MPQTIDLDGVEYEFPDDATQEQITSYLRKVSPPNKVQEKAKANLAELNAAPIDRKRGLYAGADPTTEEPDLRGSGVGAAFEAGGQAFQRGVGRVAGNLAAVPSALDRAVDDAGEFIVGGGLTGAPKPLDPFDGQPVKKGVPLYAGKRILDTPQTSGGPAMLSGVADDLRHGLREMPSGYSQALAKKNLWEKVQDPTWYADMLAGNAPQMGVSLAGGALGGRAGAAAASGWMMAGDEFQRTQDYEEETGRRAENAGLKALLSGGLQGALDSIVPGSIATGGVKANAKGALRSFLTEGGTEDLQLLISDLISPAETRSFGERMTDPKYLMDLAEEGLAGGIMGGAMHPLGESGLRPTQPNSQTLKRTPSPADIIGGRDGATGMQPVDMRVPPSGPRMEKGVSAATPPDKAARVVPADAPIPNGMEKVDLQDGTLLLYDPAKTQRNFSFVRAMRDPAAREAYLAEHGAKPVTDTSSGTATSTTGDVPAAPPPLLVPPVAQTDAEVAELAKQIAARPVPPKALKPEEVAKKIERLVADPRTTPEEREILVAKYEQLTKVVRQRGQDAAVAKEMGPLEEPLDAGLPPPESDPYSDDFYLAEALRATEQSAGRTDRLGAPRPYGEQAGTVPEDMVPLEEPPVEIPPAAIAERQRLEAAAQAERNPAPVEQVLSEVPPEAVAQAVEALAPPPSEAPGTSFAERQKAKRAEPKVTTPVADQKAAAAFTPVQLKQAEQLVKLAYHSEKTADGPTERTRAEREVERAERDARAMGVDVDAISRSVGRETREVTPQVTIETSPFMQARRAAEAAAAKEATPEPKKKASKSRVSAEVEANMLGDVEDAAAGNGNQFQDAAGRLATSERKARTVGINDSAIAAARARGEAKATGKTKKTPKPDAPKTVEKKLAAAVAKEKALRAKRDADPENEALLDEYNEATAELYALTKEANGKGVSTLDVTTDDDTPSLMKTIPQREARAEAFGDKPVMTREAFDKALEDAKKRLPGIAHLVDALNSQADLPASVAAVANGDRIDGFTQNGRVAVVADGMTSAEHVAATLAHEAVGHLVPEAVFGKNEWRKRLNDMMASSQWFRDFVANFGKSETGRRYPAAELASEAIAFEANRVLDDANYKPPNAYRMFIAKLREWLREAVGARKVIGLSKVLEFSDRDLAAFIARSKRTAETGLPKNRRKGDGKPSFAKSQGVDPQDMADSLRTVTEEPEGGPRTVLGRPERANPGLNPEGRAATVAYEQNRPDVEPQKVADWQEAGERIALEPGALKRLTEKEGQLTPEEVYAAKLLISDEGLASFKDPSRLDTLIRLMDKYVESGRNAARELRARTDDVLSPADRHRQYIMEALVEDFPESSWKKLLLGEMEKGDSRTRLEKLRDGLSGAFGRAIADKPFQGETPQERADRAKKLIAGLKKDTGIDIQSPDFDFSDRGAVLDVMKYLGANRASISDKAFELWQNNILSGPLTHKFNTISNLTNGLVQFGILKPLEGLYSGGVPGMRDALAVWKGTLPGISRGLANAAYGWENEVRRSAMIGSDQKFREGVGRTGKIGGKWGKRIRASYRALLAEDEFFRGVWGEMQAASTAYGIARREGLKGDALTKRMQELQADPHSDAWLDNDEIVDEYLFQEKLGDVGRAVVNLRNNIPGLRYIIPFVSTNVNVAKRGFSFLPGAGVLSELAGHKGGSKDASLGARIAARQTVGVLMTMAVIGMLDDEEDPLISGSPVASRIGENRQAERDFQMRTGGAQSIKLGDDWYSFARLEPFATTVSVIADFITATKKARKSGEWGKEASGAFGKLANQFAEKTFLANLGTIYKATIGGNPTEEIPNLIGNIGGGFIPASGALRQFARMADPNIREVGVWGAQKPDDKGETKVDRQARRILFRVMPIASWFGAEPKVSVYGDEYEKGSGPLQQLFSPFEKQPKQNPDQQLLDLAIRRMNLRNPGNEYYPPVAERSATQGEDEAGEYGEDPVSRKFNQYFSDRELHDLAQTRGKAAVAHLKELMAEYGGKLPTEGRPNTPGFREAFKLGTEEGLQKIGARE